MDKSVYFSPSLSLSSWYYLILYLFCLDIYSKLFIHDLLVTYFLIILYITWMSWILCIPPRNLHYRRLLISVWRTMMPLLQLQDLLNHSELLELKIGWICIRHLELQCDYMVEYLWRARVECVRLDQPWFANIKSYVLYNQKFRFIIDYK